MMFDGAKDPAMPCMSNLFVKGLNVNKYKTGVNCEPVDPFRRRLDFI